MPPPDKKRYPKEYKKFCIKNSRSQTKIWENLNPAQRRKKIKLAKEAQNTFEVKKKMVESAIKSWKDPKKRKNRIDGMNSAEGRKNRIESANSFKVRKKRSKSLKKFNYLGFAKNRVKIWKKKCIKYGGRYCKKCGLDLLNSRAHFHHIFLRELYSFGILYRCGIDNKNWNDYKNEMDKCLLLCRPCSSSIHWRSYDYLVKINKHQEYVDWYLKTYKTKVFKGYVKKGIIKHHVDRNYKNNDCLYLENKDHVSLHRTSYYYLVKIGKIEKYIKWFLKTPNDELDIVLWRKVCYANWKEKYKISRS